MLALTKLLLLTKWVDAPARVLMSLLFLISGVGKLAAVVPTQAFMEQYGVPESARPPGRPGGATRTGATPTGGCVRSSRRQPYSWPGWIPASRATADTLPPGSSVAATSCHFSAGLQRRRRRTDVMIC